MTISKLCVVGLLSAAAFSVQAAPANIYFTDPNDAFSSSGNGTPEVSFFALGVETPWVGFFGLSSNPASAADAALIAFEPIPAFTGSIELFSCTAEYATCSTSLGVGSTNTVYAKTIQLPQTPDQLLFKVELTGATEKVDLNGNLTAVPVPAAAWLFGSALLGLAGVARRRDVA